MRILLVSQHFWPEGFRINDVARALAAQGCEVTVLTGQPNYPDGDIYEGYKALGWGYETFAGCEVVRVPLLPRRRGRAVHLVANYLSFIASSTIVGAWLLRGRAFDAVFVYGTSPILQAITGIVLKRLKRAPLVTWVQDLWPQSLEVTGFVRNRRALAAVAAVVRWIYRRNDLLLVQSRAFVPTVQAMAGGTPVAYHPNPSEWPAETSHESADEPALRAAFNVVFAGNLGTVQALDTILAAAERLRHLPDVRIVLVGSGSRSEWLRTEVERRGLANVDLPGRFPAAAMPAVFARASALLLTLARSDILAQTIPSKLQAYLAAGKPIVAALDGEGARVVADAGAGLVCAAEDAAGLAAAIAALHDTPPARLAAMGDAGRRYHEAHFDPVVLARELREHLARASRAHHAALPRGSDKTFKETRR